MVTEIRCSSLAYAMRCIGSLSYVDLEKPEAGQAANDGTACGEILSAMIRQRTPKPQMAAYASNGTFLDTDMWFHATEVYNDLLVSAQGNPIETEERIDWQTRAGITIRGQFDASYVVGDTLHVGDLKYGYGLVEVKENWQVIGYAIGQVFKLKQMYNYTPAKICLTIHQPRPYHREGRTRSWEISLQELLEDYLQRIVKMTDMHKEGYKTLSATPKNCKYCPAMHSCEAFNEMLYDAVQVVKEEWKQDTLANPEVAKQLDLLKSCQEILKIKHDSLQQLAIMRLQQNQIIPGFAYEHELGDRKWKDGVTANSVAVLAQFNVTKEAMMSPNQAEKAGLNKKFVAQLTERASAGMKLVKKDIVAEAIKILPKPY